MGEDSILISIKKLLGIQEDDSYFDTDIIININSVFSILTQLGVGPKEGFAITGNAEQWTDFIGDDPRLASVKSYAYMRVRMLFDPPLSASVAEAINAATKEFEWRLNIEAESQQEENSK
jgi:hypothetical protein